MTNTKGTTMPQIDDAELFGNAEDQRAYEDFCANQEAVEKFTLDKPALICRWRMSNKKVPMLNRHIRALSERLVQGEPLTHNMLSWAKQHVEWSLAEGDYTAHDGVLMLVIDVNGNAAMTVGEYEPLADTSAKALRARSAEARSEADETGVAPELARCRQQRRAGLCGASGRVSVWHGDAHRAAGPDQGHPGYARRHSRTAQGRLVPGKRRARRGACHRRRRRRV